MVFPFILYQLAFIFKLLIEIAKGVNKLVGNVSINLLHHAKSAICVINIIIDTPAIAYAMEAVDVVHLNKLI